VSLRQHLATRGVELRALAPDARQAEIGYLGTALMEAVGRVVPALPVSLVATVILDAGYPLTQFELKGRVFALIHNLEHSGAYVHIPRHDRDYAIEVGLRMLKLRHLVIERDASFSANPDERALLKYYANAIAHLPPLRSGVADAANAGIDQSLPGPAPATAAFVQPRIATPRL